MATLADLNVEILANTQKYAAGLKDAQEKTKTFADKTGGLLKGVGALATGGTLLAVGAAGAAASGFIATVKGLTDVEKELRPATERSRIAAESLQVLAEAAKRAGSEDGLEAIVDSAQELQLQLGEIAVEGDSRATPALKALGLEAEALQKLEPEAAFRAVVAELQKIPNAADKATAAENVFGGSSELLAGIVNLTTAEFAALEAEVEATSNILSGDALADAKKFDQEMKNLKASLSAGAQAFAVDMLPAMTDVVTFINESGLPAWKDLKAKALDPVQAFITSDVVPRFVELGEELGPLAEEVVPKVNEVFKGLKAALDPIFTTAVPNVTGAFEGLGDILRPLTETPLPNAVELFGKLGEKATPVTKGFTDFAEVVGPLLPDLNTLAENLQNLLPGQSILSKLADKVFPILEPYLDTFLEQIGPLGEKLLPAFGSALEAMNPFLETAADLFEEIAPFIENAAKLMSDQLNKALENLVDLIEDPVIPTLKDLAGFFDINLPESTKVTTGELEHLTEGLGEMGVAAAENAAKIDESLPSTFENIVNGIEKNVVPAVEDLHDRAWPLLEQAWEQTVKPTFQAFADFAKDVIVPSLKVEAAIIVGIWKGIDQEVVKVMDTIATSAETWLETLGGVIRGGLALIQGDWSTAWDEVKGIHDAWKEGIQAGFEIFGVDIGQIWTDIWTGVNDHVTGVLDGIVAYVTTMPGKIAEAIKDIPKIFSEPFSDAFDNVKGWIARGSMVEYIKLMPDLVADAISSIPNVFGETFEEAYDRVQAGADAMAASVVSSANQASRALAGISGGNRGTNPADVRNIPSFSQEILDMLKARGIAPPGGGVPVLDHGGIVTRPTFAGLAMDGQPEAVIPLGGVGGGRMAMAGMGGGTTINIHVSGDINDAEAFYRKVNEARLEFERRGN